MNKKCISIVIPAYNEERNIVRVYDAITSQWDASFVAQYDLEIFFVDDGSTDDTIHEISALAKRDARVHFIEFSRNFGKEIATTAGIHHCSGDACIMMDADLQHPVEILPQFVKRWENGFEVVIGVRKTSKSDKWIKRCGGRVFYRIMQAISVVPIIPQATDYRLLDRIVIDAFNQLPERNRITRGLIDWLGFRRTTILFDAQERCVGKANYSTWKLFRLATTSVISMSMLPLRLTGYLGIIIVVMSSILGAVMFLDRYVTDWGMHFSGTAILATITLFLIGIVLIAIGLLAFYVEHIYNEAQGRQMYIVRRKI